MQIDKKIIRFKSARSSGPGGQRANRRSTKVQLWVQIGKLPLTDLEKKRIRVKLARHINHKDELEVMSEEERSQEMNRVSAVQKLNKLVNNALKIPKKRIPIVPSRRAEDLRIKEKKIISAKKQARRLKS